jgi:hypothetical protein
MRAATRPRRMSLSSTTSSCSRVAVCMNSTLVEVGSLRALDILSSAAAVIAEGEVMQLTAAKNMIHAVVAAGGHLGVGTAGEDRADLAGGGEQLGGLGSR